MYVRAGHRMRFRGLGDYSALALAMQQQEGWFPGSVSYTNNNPGNLMAAGQPGCTPTSSGFCSFSSYAAGFQALMNQIALDASRGETISQFTAKYAPAAAGNDPVTYAANISSAVGLAPSDALASADFAPAADATTFGYGLPDVSGDLTAAAAGLDVNSVSSFLSSLPGGPVPWAIGAAFLIGLWAVS